MIELERLVDGLADSLESAGFDYAFGGALALSYWAPPRATAAIDLDLFVDGQALERGFAAIEAAGFVVRASLHGCAIHAVHQILRNGRARRRALWCAGWRLAFRSCSSL